MIARPYINVDVLHNVIPYTDLSTVVQLTKTCHEFNAECAHYLLSGGVYLEGEGHVESFIAFLTASGRHDYAQRRLPFFIGVELSIGPSPSQSIKIALGELFTRIESDAARFTFLALHNSDAVLAPDSPLPKAVAALTTLEELALYDYGSHCAGVLWAMQSRLLTVKLARDLPKIRYFANNFIQDPLGDPLYLLHHSRETLERMEVSLPFSVRHGVCYPNLVELNICCAECLPKTWTYVRAFPNLADLTVKFGGDMLSQERAPSAFACRQWNIAEQHRLGTWNTLRHVKGTLEDMFLLGLTCPVPALTIHVFTLGSGDQGLGRCEAEAWRQVMASARPSRVTLVVGDSDWIVADHGLWMLTNTPRLVLLQCLDLVVSVSYDTSSDPEDLGHLDGLDLLWVAVAAFIKPVDLSITFSWAGWGTLARRASSVAGDDVTDPAFPREAFDAVDINDHARRFVHAHTRSVRYSLVGPDGWRREAWCFGPNVLPEERAAIIEEQMEVD